MGGGGGFVAGRRGGGPQRLAVFSEQDSLARGFVLARVDFIKHNAPAINLAERIQPSGRERAVAEYEDASLLQDR